MEFNPLSTGITGSREVLLADIHGGTELDESDTCAKLNLAVSEGFVFERMIAFDTDRRMTLGKHLGGSVYTISDVRDENLRMVLDEWSRQCGIGVSVAKLTIGGNPVYTAVIEGEKNPVKSLFGNDVDKFAVLSSLKMHRDSLFVGSYADGAKDFASLGLI